MELIVVYLALCLVAGVIAANKGRSGFGYFILALLLSPLVGIVAAAAAARNQDAIDRTALDAGGARRCPFCDELVRPAAKVCKHCSRDLPPPPASTRSADA